MSKSNSQRGSNPHLRLGRPRVRNSRDVPSNLTREHLAGMPIPLTGLAIQPSPFRAPQRVRSEPPPSANTATADAPGVNPPPAVNLGPLAQRDDSTDEVTHGTQGELFPVPSAASEHDAAELPEQDEKLLLAALVAELPSVLREMLSEVRRTGGHVKPQWQFFLAAAVQAAQASGSGRSLG